MIYATEMLTLRQEAVILARLEEAGATLLALPGRGYGTGLRTTRMDVVQSALEAYGWQGAAVRAPCPSAAAISRMDEAFGWLRLIPDGQFVLRRIAGARALVHPVSGRHLFAWRKIASSIGADHKSVQRWHGQAIALMARATSGVLE